MAAHWAVPRVATMAAHWAAHSDEMMVATTDVKMVVHSVGMTGDLSIESKVEMMAEH